MREKVRWIWDTWRPLRAWFVILAVFTLLSSLVSLAYPLALGAIIDQVEEALADPQATQHQALVRDALLILFAIGLARFGANYYPALRAYLNDRIEQSVRATYFAVVLRKGERFFSRFRTGDLVTRLTDDIADYPKIAWFCCSGIFRAVDSASKFLFCLAAMLILDPRLALLSIVPLPAMAILFFILKRRLRRRVERQRRAISATNDILEASFSGVRVIKAHNAEGRQVEALERQLRDRIGAEFDVITLWQLIDGFYNSLSAVGQVIVVAYGGLLVIRGEMSPGTFYAFYVYLAMLVQPLLDLPNLFVTGRQAFVCIDREEEIRRSETREEGGTFRGARSPGTFERLDVRGLSYAYPRARDPADQAGEPDEQRAFEFRPVSEAASSDPVLAGIDLQLEQGEKLAIVGRVGAGKSTLLRLIAGALNPQAGEIRINGHPLPELSAAEVRPRIGLVDQRAALFSDSLRENVLMGRPLDQGRLDAAVAAVGLTEEIGRLPEGIDQRLGQGGVALSGGQRQRLAIARAIYGRPELLLLDDLTSALDAENEDRLWRYLEELTPRAAFLVVTHRIATARAMDRIAIMDEGRIVQVGSHEELMASSELYREFQHEWSEETQHAREA